jgi:hypothetical protein
VSKKPSPGGTVQISHKPYVVLEGPRLEGSTYRIMVMASDNGAYWAAAPRGQCGRGPWKIQGPVVGDDQ